MTADEHAPITLEDAARLLPDGSVTANTLRLRIRQGRLQAYKPGKKYLTTAKDVRDMIETCKVTPARRPPCPTQNARDSNEALETAIAKLRTSKKRR